MRLINPFKIGDQVLIYNVHKPNKHGNASWTLPCMCYSHSCLVNLYFLCSPWLGLMHTLKSSKTCIEVDEAFASDGGVDQGNGVTPRATRGEGCSMRFKPTHGGQCDSWLFWSDAVPIAPSPDVLSSTTRPCNHIINHLFFLIKLPHSHRWALFVLHSSYTSSPDHY